jgi:hypothetical protein
MSHQPDPKSVRWLTAAYWVSVAVLALALAFRHEWSLIVVLAAIVLSFILDERLRRGVGDSQPGQTAEPPDSGSRQRRAGD